MDGWMIGEINRRMDGWKDSSLGYGTVFVSIHAIMCLCFHREHVVYNIFCLISNMP